MWSSLLLCAALSLAQTEPAPPELPPAAALPAAPDRWALMKVLQGTWPGSLLDDNRMSIWGWTDASFTASTDRHSNLPLGFNYRANEPLLQQNWVRFDRSVLKSGTTDPTFGFRADAILPGSDYRFTLARGIFDQQLTAAGGQPQRYGIDPVQFYAEAYFPTIGRGLDIKVGHFFAQFGVESIAAVDNALWSHSYTFIYNPFTHTGALGTLNLTDTWSVQAGIVLGSDIFIDPADSPTGIGSIKWAPPGGRDSVLFSFIVGNGRFDQQRNFHNPEIFDLVWTHKINSRLAYNFEGLYGFTTNVPDRGFAHWFGVLNYLTYTFTPRLNGTSRLEFFDDPQGQRTGFPGLYSALTLGLNYQPCPSVVVRPEIRYDLNDRSRPFDDRHGLFTAGFDVILRW